MRDVNSDHHLLQPKGLLTLSAGVLLAPFAWFLHQQVSYLLVYRACATGSQTGFAVWSVVMLVMAGAGAFLAWRAWNHAGRGWSNEGDRVLDRCRFLALGGLMGSGFFSLVIAAQWIPTLLLSPCVR